MDGNMSFRTRLKELRAQAQISQEELARRAELSVAALRGLEQTDRDPQWSTVVKLAQALGVSVEAFDDSTSADGETELSGRPAKEPAVQPTKKTNKKGKKNDQ